MGIISTTTAFAFGSAEVDGTEVAITDEAFDFTSAELAKAQRARVSVSAHPVRFTYDGTTPTTGIGHYLGTTETIEIVGNENIVGLAFIRESGGAPSVVSITLET